MTMYNSKTVVWQKTRTYGWFLHRQIREKCVFRAVFYRQLFSGDKAGDKGAVSLLNKTKRFVTLPKDETSVRHSIWYDCTRKIEF